MVSLSSSIAGQRENSDYVRVRVCVRACVRASVRVYLRACVRLSIGIRHVSYGLLLADASLNGKNESTCDIYVSSTPSLSSA